MPTGVVVDQAVSLDPADFGKRIKRAIQFAGKNLSFFRRAITITEIRPPFIIPYAAARAVPPAPMITKVFTFNRHCFFGA